MSNQKYMQVDRRALLGAGGVLMLGAILQSARLCAQGSSPSRIGIIGSGNIGGTIGGLWVKNGHPVF
ncbi:MAG TPA: NADP oxidoreductase, partial [Pseudolabrys sp.]